MSYVIIVSDTSRYPNEPIDHLICYPPIGMCPLWIEVLYVIRSNWRGEWGVEGYKRGWWDRAG